MSRPYRRRWIPDGTDPRPTLAAILKTKRKEEGLDTIGAAKAADVPYAAARDAELSLPVLAPEAAKLAQWCGAHIDQLQAPPPIVQRLTGRTAPKADPRLAPAILAHIAQGQPLSKFTFPGMELRDTQIYGKVALWLRKDAKFKEAYMAAKETAALMHGEQVLDIADNAKTSEDIEVAKFQIDIKLRMARTFNRPVFAEKAKSDAPQQLLLPSFGDALERLNSAKRQAPEQLPAPAQTLQTIDIPDEEPEEFFHQDDD